MAEKDAEQLHPGVAAGPDDGGLDAIHAGEMS
jgi:hypothetical protein